MTLPTEVPPEDLVSFYYSPNTIRDAVHFLGHIRNYERTKENDYLYSAHDIAMSSYDRCPFDEVMIEDGLVTDSPSEVMLMVCLHLKELGMMPSYE